MAGDAVPPFAPLSDGVVTLRPSRAEDAAALVAGRDEEFRRWMGQGADDPRPTACIWVGDELVGWVDHDWPRPWLGPGEVNVGYAATAAHRGRGYVTRAVQLLGHLLAVGGRHHTMTVLVGPDNLASLAVAGRAGFVRAGTVEGSVFARRPVPPLAYTDGVVSLRPLPSTSTGPSWNFTVVAEDASQVAFVNCDLANPHVPAGEADVSFAAHPAHRGAGHVTRGVRLVMQFLREHTGARTAHLVVDVDDVPSLRIARAVGARERERWSNDAGRTIARHVDL